MGFQEHSGGEPVTVGGPERGTGAFISVPTALPSRDGQGCRGWVTTPKDIGCLSTVGLEERTHSFPQQMFIEHLPSISQGHEIEEWANKQKSLFRSLYSIGVVGVGGEHQQANQLLTCQVVC